MNKRNFSINKQVKSFFPAFNGFISLLKSEHNARIQLFAFCIALIAAYILNISRFEWIIIIIVSGFVIAAEALNTSIEKICDFINPQTHPEIKIIKDVAAFAVLVSAVTALISGLLIFLPPIIGYINN